MFCPRDIPGGRTGDFDLLLNESRLIFFEFEVVVLVVISDLLMPRSPFRGSSKDLLVEGCTQFYLQGVLSIRQLFCKITSIAPGKLRAGRRRSREGRPAALLFV